MVERCPDKTEVLGSIPSVRTFKGTLMLNLEVIYKDKSFLAVNKPAGMLVHGTRINEDRGHKVLSKEEETLVDWLLENYPEVREVGDSPEVRPGIVHRLDKDTSGIIVVARNQKYFEYLKGLFQEHKIKKTYLALVWGTLRDRRGVIKKSIALKSGTTRRTVFGGKMEKEAITEYEVIKTFPEKNFSLLRIYPKTGRTHQIRVHLKSIGHPVVNDQIYGNKTLIGGGRLMLHALSLEFETNPGKVVFLEADPPDDFQSGVIHN